VTRGPTAAVLVLALAKCEKHYALSFLIDNRFAIFFGVAAEAKIKKYIYKIKKMGN